VFLNMRYIAEINAVKWVFKFRRR